LFRRFLNSISSSFSGLLEKSQTVRPLKASDVTPTMVDNACTLTITAAAARSDRSAPVEPEQGLNKATRFRRTAEEISLGLNREQAIEFRKNAGVADKHHVPDVEPKTQGQKRFRRTAEEIKLGLSIEEARARRERAAAPVMKKLIIKGQAVEKKEAFEQLEDMLSPKTRARARAVSRYRARGGKAFMTPETMDQIETFIAAGKVKQCPPCIDSDGYDHLNQREAR
jgi:hypothetical protein